MQYMQYMYSELTVLERQRVDVRELFLLVCISSVATQSFLLLCLLPFQLFEPRKASGPTAAAEALAAITTGARSCPPWYDRQPTAQVSIRKFLGQRLRLHSAGRRVEDG